MKYVVTFKIKYPCNKETHTEDIAAFTQPHEAAKFASDKAKERMKTGDNTPFMYVASDDGIPFSKYFNKEEL